MVNADCLPDFSRTLVCLCLDPQNILLYYHDPPNSILHLILDLPDSLLSFSEEVQPPLHVLCVHRPLPFWWDLFS